ncbi:hypothetical protein A3D83_01045 [Candidatus Daviesbacteria bacterium RIFCSPHIGHO2_02_FULL_41_10]|uniref:Uncharacterized protein n=1 Tax=Candidatus Daviesbacteria bacterium RIFCSPHIGHO2_02_FULL_41_10 TaxID=1797774 RepID=A0A1F5JY19_9BACT|nr:MAG: hypothetical protein A3D83_01045 [Candidatus Daviesbacteria bacterium RIFCSPHIGHO2_02_FULL_41_10]
MIITTLLLSFFLNIVNHGNIFIAVLNILLLFLSIYIFLKFARRNFDSPLMILVGAIPVFTKANNILITCFAIGLCLLILFYLTTKFKKISVLILIAYILSTCLYANGLIKPPFSFQTNLLIVNDDWTNFYITQMKTESQYMPNIVRSIIFNQSAHFYVILSKIAALFSLENLISALLLANIYPFVKGLTSDLKNWNKSKTLLIFCILLISLSMVVSRSEQINNTFILLSPFLVYFILRGLNSVNKKIYLALFVISVVIATSP